MVKSNKNVNLNNNSNSIKSNSKESNTVTGSFSKINKSILIKDIENSDIIIKSLLLNVENFLEKEIYFKTDSKVVIAVSGGVDSVSMLDIFANLTIKYPFMQLFVAHYNHKLRGISSDKDEEFVKKLANRYRIQFFNSFGDVQRFSNNKSLSLEHAARTLRYKFLERIAKKVDADYIITAHTADDSAETFFINLFRGSGLTGLSGIPSRRTIIKRISLLRPLINVRKQQLIDYAKLRSLRWREDESNQLLFFTRNKVRHELLPNLEQNFSPAVINVINRAQKLIQGADNIISKNVQKALQSLTFDKSAGKFGLKLNLFQTYDDFLKGEIIQKAILNNFGFMNISLQTIDRILDIEEKPVGSICEINKYYYVLRDRNSLTFIKKDPVSELNKIIEKEGEFDVKDHKIILTKINKNQVKFTGDPNIEFLDWDLIPSRLYLRNWKQGDSFEPLGMEGSMKISDFLINNKISLSEKNKIILLATKSEIIWICGMRLNNSYKVTSMTTKYLKIELVKNKKVESKK